MINFENSATGTFFTSSSSSPPTYIKLPRLIFVGYHLQIYYIKQALLIQLKKSFFGVFLITSNFQIKPKSQASDSLFTRFVCFEFPVLQTQHSKPNISQYFVWDFRPQLISNISRQNFKFSWKSHLQSVSVKR